MIIIKDFLIPMCASNVKITKYCKSLNRTEACYSDAGKIPSQTHECHVQLAQLASSVLYQRNVQQANINVSKLPNYSTTLYVVCNLSNKQIT